MSELITTRIILDENRPYFFPGECIKGKVMLTSPRTITPHAIRLIWAGGVTIRPTLQDHESHIYFRHNYAICNDKLNGRKIGNGIAYNSSAFVENLHTIKSLELTLEQSVTYSFAFEVKVPSDIPLPSSTEAEASMLGGKIVYTIESCIDFIKDDASPARCHIMVTVLEHMDVRLPELTVPRSEESVCSLWLPHTPLASPCNYRTAMRATIPCQASTRGGQAEIVIHLWHSVEYRRLKGVKVSLLRLRQLHFNGSVYAFPDETVIAKRADVDLKQDRNFMQTLRCNLPIRDDLTPSISDSAKLLEISYKLQIKVQLQEGTYQSLDGECKDYMAVELPFLIGTVPLISKGRITPSKSHPSGTNLSSSEQTNGTNDHDNGSIQSAESNGKQGNNPMERKVSKNKSKTGRTLRDILRIPGSKSKTKEKSSTVITATTDSTAQSSNINDPDSISVLSHSRTSSSKNTDQDLPYSIPDDSTTSHSATSPTTTESKAPQAPIFELRNIRSANTSPYSLDEEITASPYELKPDEKDDEYFDHERLTVIYKHKADAIATAPTVSPISGIKLPPQPPLRVDSLTSTTTESKLLKDDTVIPGNDDSMPWPTVDHDVPKKTHHVHYHDIFGSSGEEDSDEDDQCNDKDREDCDLKSKYNMASDTKDDHDTTTINKPAENNDDQRHLRQHDRDPTTTILEKFSQHKQLPSPPIDKIDYNKGHGSESDSSDDSPVTLMSKQSRRLQQKSIR